MVKEYVFGKVGDVVCERIEKWIDKDKAQKILLKCFNDYYEDNKEKLYVDKEAILAIDSNKIKPNKRPEEIIENLKGLFKKCILTDDTYELKHIEIEIVYNYLKEANEELLKLYHIDEDIHNVEDIVLENREVLNEHHKEMTKEIHGIRSVLRNDIQPILYFIEELDNSRMYCYIVLKVSDEVDDWVIQEIEGMAMTGAEYSQYMKDGIYCIDINFVDPLCQSDLRDYLKVIDKYFSDNNIGIYSILTHQ